MKTLLYTITLVLFGSILFAQSPVITENNVYLVGDVVPISICNDPVDPGVSGENVTWDMSFLSEEEEQSFTFVSPDDTPWDYQFTESSLCGISWDDSYSFYQVSSSGVSVDGYTSYSNEAQTDTAKIVMSDSEELIPLPLEYGDTQSDEFSGVTEAGGFTIPFEGEIDFEADAYGTLILPNGTFENVVRYHFTREQVNTFMGISTTQTKEQWGWMSADNRFWLLIMEITNDGFSNQELVWYAKNPLILSAENLEIEEINVFPNPSSGDQMIYFNSSFEANAAVQLYTLDGKLISQENQFISMGTNEISPEKQLASGIYMLSITSENISLVSKLVIK